MTLLYDSQSFTISSFIHRHIAKDLMVNINHHPPGFTWWVCLKMERYTPPLPFINREPDSFSLWIIHVPCRFTYIIINFPWVFHTKQPENPKNNDRGFLATGLCWVHHGRGRLGRCSGSQHLCPGAKIWPIGTRTEQSGKEAARKRQDIHQKNANISMIMYLCVYICIIWYMILSICITYVYIMYDM